MFHRHGISCSIALAPKDLHHWPPSNVRQGEVRPCEQQGRDSIGPSSHHLTHAPLSGQDGRTAKHQEGFRVLAHQLTATSGPPFLCLRREAWCTPGHRSGFHPAVGTAFLRGEAPEGEKTPVAMGILKASRPGCLAPSFVIAEPAHGSPGPHS